MSADNWAICPKCGNDTAGVGEEPAKNMREDYELYTDGDGVFHVSYSANCSTRHGGCGFSFTFKHAESAIGGKESA